jgi:hypothetical protein
VWLHYKNGALSLGQFWLHYKNGTLSLEKFWLHYKNGTLSLGQFWLHYKNGTLSVGQLLLHYKNGAPSLGQFYTSHLHVVIKNNLHLFPQIKFGMFSASNKCKKKHVTSPACGQRSWQGLCILAKRTEAHMDIKVADSCP